MMDRELRSILRGLSWQKPWWKRVHEAVCYHTWQEHEGNSAKRKCSKCGRIEWLFSNPYPMPGEIKYVWKEMR